MQDLILRYGKPAENSIQGWENESLPIGNGYLGVNVFGGIQNERLQITDPTFFTKGKNTYYRTMTNFAELYFDFDHNDVKNYERGLDLNKAKAYVKYNCDGVDYGREYFASYPAKVIVMKFTSSKKGKLNFEIVPKIPYTGDYHEHEGDGGGKTGVVFVKDNSIVLKGKADWFNIMFEAQLRVLSNTGETIYNENSISVRNSDEVVLVFSSATNYELCPEVFLEEDDHKKLRQLDPHVLVENVFASCASTYDELEHRHLEDYQNLFLREKLSVENCVLPDEYTDELLRKCNDEFIPYLEILYFQFARFMMISSSRRGGVPASLQGIWNAYKHAPWGSGIWHNVNVQMNYWLSFAGNIPETFIPYADYFKAYLDVAKKNADKYIEDLVPENKSADGENGFTIGTEATPYHISTLTRSHSGPGNVGFISQLFWSYYDYTRDEDGLKNITYPALEEASKFLTKCVKKYDDVYLSAFSASPEQNCVKRMGVANASPYNTIGCAYDQQMITDNGKNFIEAADALGIENDTVKIQKEQINHYNPVEIGWSGQVKEYSEEKFYGEIGEYCHRHISQLVGLYPGNIINSNTPAWLDAAKYTLNERGDDSTGWALAHRMCSWARTGDGDRVHKLFRLLLSQKTCDNLWDLHPPFQIDGNFGASAAVAEMLVQSHEGYISILPALPSRWKSGKCEGFAARGGFDVDVEWKNNSATFISILSKKGMRANVKYYGISEAFVECNGKRIEFEICDDNKISFETTVGGVYTIKNLKPRIFIKSPADIKVDRDTLKIIWKSDDDDVKYNVYRAVESEPCYTKIAENLSECNYTDSINFADYEIVKYKVTATFDGVESEGIFKTINHATDLEIDRYENSIRLRKPPENSRLITTSTQFTIY